MPTNQEAFDIALNGILQQGGPSLDKENVNCMYRSHQGRKCAIGWLIPDDKYNPDFEKKGIFNDIVSNTMRELGYNDINFLTNLQHCHDCCKFGNKFISSFKSEMKELATNYGLHFNEEYSPSV